MLNVTWPCLFMLLHLWSYLVSSQFVHNILGFINEFGSSNGSPPTTTIFLLALLLLMTFDLFLLILNPVLSDVAGSLVVLFCIWSCLCARRARSAMKNNSSSCVQGVHYIPFFFHYLVVQSIKRLKKHCVK